MGLRIFGVCLRASRCVWVRSLTAKLNTEQRRRPFLLSSDVLILRVGANGGAARGTVSGDVPDRMGDAGRRLPDSGAALSLRGSNPKRDVQTGLLSGP
jgi:hypothetical protein